MLIVKSVVCANVARQKEVVMFIFSPGGEEAWQGGESLEMSRIAPWK